MSERDEETRETSEDKVDGGADADSSDIAQPERWLDESGIRWKAINWGGLVLMLLLGIGAGALVFGGGGGDEPSGQAAHDHGAEEVRRRP